MIYSKVGSWKRSDSVNDSHSATLIAKHARLDAQIASETRRAAPDEMLVSMLKKQKLRIKEALSRLR